MKILYDILCLYSKGSHLVVVDVDLLMLSIKESKPPLRTPSPDTVQCLTRPLTQ